MLVRRRTDQTEWRKRDRLAITAKKELSIFQGTVKRYLTCSRELKKFVNQQAITRLQHHQQTVDMLRRAKVLGQLGVQVAA